MDNTSLRRMLLAGLMLVAAATTQGQTVTTMGKDFWVTFMQNYSVTADSVECYLLISGPRACTGTAGNPATGWDTTFNVTPGEVTTVTLPHAAHCYTEATTTPTATGIHVETTDTVSVYGSNYMAYSFDATAVYPTPVLGWEYIVQTYGPTVWSSEFVVLAVEDSTLITVTPTENCHGDIQAGSTIAMPLMQGETFLFITDSSSSDLSGSTITTNGKRVAVFTGNQCATIPATYAACDHLYEQLPPVDYWGRKFVITNSSTRSADVFRITSSGNNCHIYIDGQYRSTLQARQTAEYSITESQEALYVETTQPALVNLFEVGGEYGGDNGDPSMVLINPVEQQMSKVTFATLPSTTNLTHYANIVTSTHATGAMRLDGQPIGGQFHTVGGNADFSYARIELAAGTHTLNNSGSGFLAHIYGLGSWESYAYTTGSNAINQRRQIMVDDKRVYTGGSIVCCPSDSTKLALRSDYEMEEVCWLLGDGDTACADSLYHHYNPGTYRIKAVVAYYPFATSELYRDTLAITLVISPRDTSFDTVICCRQTYLWNDQVLTSSGYYEAHLPNVMGCDSVATLRLDMSDTVHAIITAQPPFFDQDRRQLTFANRSTGNVEEKRWSVWIDEAPQEVKQNDNIVVDVPLTADSVTAWLDVSNEHCADTDTVVIYAYNEKIFFPNAFTPSLPTNNTFRCLATGVLDYEIWIYARNGDLVFHSTDIQEGWDGTHEGTPCPQGVYVFTCKYTTELIRDSRQQQTHSIMLLR